MQTPPIPILTEEEKNVLALWATQQPENIALAQKMCKPVLKMSQKALMQKAGLDCIHEHGHRLKELPPNVLFKICTDSNPLWGFEYCQLPIPALKVASKKSRVKVDGNQFFLPLAKLPYLNTLQTNIGKTAYHIYEEYSSQPITITEGLKSLVPLQSLTTLSNFKLLGVDTFSDIQHLKKLKTLVVNLEDDEIVPFFKTIQSESLEQLEINLRSNGNLSIILEEDLYDAFIGIAERLPKLFYIQGTDFYNIIFKYDSWENAFAKTFHQTIGQYFSDKDNKKVKPRK